MRRYNAGIQCRCFVGLTLLGSTQTDYVNGRGTFVHTWLHYPDTALAQQVVRKAQLRHNTSMVYPTGCSRRTSTKLWSE